jgi:hypothetical protein
MPAPKKYPDELCERAVRPYREPELYATSDYTLDELYDQGLRTRPAGQQKPRRRFRQPC